MEVKCLFYCGNKFPVSWIPLFSHLYLHKHSEAVDRAAHCARKTQDLFVLFISTSFNSGKFQKKMPLLDYTITSIFPSVLNLHTLLKPWKHSHTHNSIIKHTEININKASEITTLVCFQIWFILDLLQLSFMESWSLTAYECVWKV